MTAPAPIKKSKFQITGFTTSNLEENDERLCDPGNVECDSSLAIPAVADDGSRNRTKSGSLSVEPSKPPAAQIPVPHVSSQTIGRFKIIRTENAYKKGRWSCKDYFDVPDSSDEQKSPDSNSEKSIELTAQTVSTVLPHDFTNPILQNLEFLSPRNSTQFFSCDSMSPIENSPAKSSLDDSTEDIAISSSFKLSDFDVENQNLPSVQYEVPVKRIVCDEVEMKTFEMNIISDNETIQENAENHNMNRNRLDFGGPGPKPFQLGDDTNSRSSVQPDDNACSRLSVQLGGDEGLVRENGTNLNIFNDQLGYGSERVKSHFLLGGDSSSLSSVQPGDGENSRPSVQPRSDASSISSVQSADETSSRSRVQSGGNAGSKSRVQSGDDASSRSRVQSGGNAGSKSRVQSGDDASSRSSVQSGGNAGSKSRVQSGDDASSRSSVQSGGDAGSKSRVQSGDDAGSRSRVQSGDNAGSRSRVQSSDDASSRSRVQSGDDASSRSRVQSGDDASSRSRVQSGDDASSRSRVQSGDDAGSKSSVQSHSGSPSARLSVHLCGGTSSRGVAKGSDKKENFFKILEQRMEKLNLPNSESRISWNRDFFLSNFPENQIFGSPLDPDYGLGSVVESAMDLCKYHLLFAVRKSIAEHQQIIHAILARNKELELENQILRANAKPETLAVLDCMMKDYKTKCCLEKFDVSGVQQIPTTSVDQRNSAVPGSQNGGSTSEGESYPAAFDGQENPAASEVKQACHIDDPERVQF